MLTIRATCAFSLATLFAVMSIHSGEKSAPNREQKLEVAYGEQGLASLKYGGAELIAPSQKPSASMSFVAANGKERTENQPENLDASAAKIVFSFPSGTIACAFQHADNRLYLEISITNNSKDEIARAKARPFAVQFPKRPKGHAWRWGYQVAGHNYGEPNVIIVDYEDALLVVCAEDAKPAIFGFEGNYRNYTANNVLFETLWDRELKDFPILPGKTETYRFSFRFALPVADAVAMASDVYAAYAKRYPFLLKWEDRRPIGALFLARDNTRWKTNPRGYFNDEKLDVFTADGKAEFKRRLMEYADRSIGVIKSVNGQGMITWDIEGQEMPHAISYLGDPRVLPQAAPEMDEMADEYFKKFRDAGLKTGICIRPSRVIPNPQGGWKHQQVDDHVAEMADKIAYAKRRWGCTIFYMDTNVKWPMRKAEEDQTRGMWQGNARLIPADDIRELYRRHPDVLIFPEFGPAGYHGAGSRYREGEYRTSPAIHAIYPRAFSVMNPKDDPLYPNWREMVEGIKSGDIFLFRGWFGDPVNDRIRQAYQEAFFRQQILPAKVAAASREEIVAFLEDPEPTVRFYAVEKVGKQKNASAVPSLVKIMKNDSEWVVRRSAAEALGRIGGQEAMDALSEALLDSKLGIQYFAAMALGEIGAPAVGLLSQALQGQDARLWEYAASGLVRIRDQEALRQRIAILEADGSHALAAQRVVVGDLAANPDKQALEALLGLLQRAPAHFKTDIIRALGAIKDERIIEPLLAILESKEDGLYYAKKEAMFALEAVTGREGNIPGRPGGGEDAAAWRKILNRPKP